MPFILLNHGATQRKEVTTFSLCSFFPDISSAKEHYAAVKCIPPLDTLQNRGAEKRFRPSLQFTFLCPDGFCFCCFNKEEACFPFQIQARQNLSYFLFVTQYATDLLFS